MPNGTTPGNDVAIDDISLVAPTGTGKLYMHIGSETLSNPAKTYTLPPTSTWVEYTIGGPEDMWGYSSNFAEIPRQYPTADGADLNTWFSMSFNHENNSGGYYEFENFRVQLFLLNSCNGGTILE
jgi:hypothetical protein